MTVSLTGYDNQPHGSKLPGHNQPHGFKIPGHNQPHGIKNKVQPAVVNKVQPAVVNKVQTASYVPTSCHSDNPYVKRVTLCTGALHVRWYTVGGAGVVYPGEVHPWGMAHPGTLPDHVPRPVLDPFYHFPRVFQLLQNVAYILR